MQPAFPGSLPVTDCDFLAYSCAAARDSHPLPSSSVDEGRANQRSCKRTNPNANRMVEKIYLVTALKSIVPVWGGHSCPLPLQLIFETGQGRSRPPCPQYTNWPRKGGAGLQACKYASACMRGLQPPRYLSM